MRPHFPAETRYQYVRDPQVGRILLFPNVSKRQYLDWRTGSFNLPASLVHPPGGQQVRACQNRLSICDGKQHERSVYPRDGLLMLLIDCFESHAHRHIQFDAVASAPLAMNCHKASRSSWCLHAAIYRNRGPCRACWNPETHRKILCLRGLHVEPRATLSNGYRLFCVSTIWAPFCVHRSVDEMYKFTYTPLESRK